jgi:hypothetical protein
MNTLTKRFPQLITLTLVLVAGSASSVLALDDKGLGGPAVKDESVQGQPRKLAGGKGNPRDAARESAQRVPHRGFLRALMSLQNDDAAASMRLTEGQLATIKQANEKFVDSATDYASTNKATIEQLRDQLPMQERRRVEGFLRVAEDIALLRDVTNMTDAPKGEPGQRGPRDANKDKGGEGAKDAQQVDEAKAKEARDQLRTIVERAPNPADAHAAMMAVLTEEQKAFVKEQGEKMRGGRGDRHGRDGPAREGEMGKGEGREGAKGKGRGQGPRLTEEQREKLKNMTPEERREFMRKMREQRRDKEGQKPGEGEQMDPR